MQNNNEDKRIFLIPNRKIRWTFAAFIIIILGFIFFFIHSYLYATIKEKDGLSGAYLTFVLTLFIIWFVGIIFFLIYLVLKYDPLKNPDSPYINETLHLPPGVFRAILTVTLLFAIVLMEGIALTNMEKYKEIQEILKPLITAFELMVAFYFGTKMVGLVSGKEEAKETKPRG